MEEEHRKSIQKNFSSLVEQTDLDLMLSSLYEKGVFSEQMIEPYKDITKDSRTRKRQLYLDLPRRGPHAFQHLVEALTEAGYWGLVRDLDPRSNLHLFNNNRNPGASSSRGSARPHENNFLSISSEKKKNKNVMETNESHFPGVSRPPVLPVVPSKIPEFHIVKSTKFCEENGDESKLYRTRSRRRGILLLFSFTEFKDDYERYRRGADVDCHNLKYLFNEFGFKTLVYNNLTQQQTLNTLKSLREVEMHRAECVFVVVSSHGDERADGSDVDVCCYDGRVTVYRFIEFFSNYNLPELDGKPKVFIFQICRGKRENRLPSEGELLERDRGPSEGELMERDRRPSETEPLERDGRSSEVHHQGARAVEPDGAPRGAHQPQRKDAQREYTDILIAHSTVPGYVSYRDTEKGSWYIQTLCEVFAAHAHQRHVLDLLTMVDEQLEATFSGQTSSIDNWGFNRRLYLHPGLFED